LSTTLQEPVPEVATTSATVPLKALNAEEVTTMATSFLKRIGHKGKLKPKRVSLEEEVYTVEIETKKLMAVVKVGTQTREITEYDVQPRSEESSFSINPKFIMTSLVISAVVTVALYFVLKMFGF
jgi:hypothetical protein